MFYHEIYSHGLIPYKQSLTVLLMKMVELDMKREGIFWFSPIIPRKSTEITLC
ncbi:DUF6392 family protein [Klebsiella pneumoniae]|uniref:DUF6392 family protein n=1 Tax=Klebsiella pneumoniae TaxID=573 RepID=UPI001C88686E